MMEAVTTTATAAAVRHRRTQAARLLADSPVRAGLSWSDLSATPDWATQDRETLDRFACATGTRAHAASLKRCIDGRMLVRLRERLGPAALKALLSDEPDVGATALLEPMAIDAASLEQLVDSTGRDWLLASIEQSGLRDALRTRLWPDAGPLLRAIHVGAAESVVRTALAACALCDAEQPDEMRSAA
jgi:hypothetical protein